MTPTILVILIIIIIVLVIALMNTLFMLSNVLRESNALDKRLDDRNNIISVLCARYGISKNEVISLSEFKEDIIDNETT